MGPDLSLPAATALQMKLYCMVCRRTVPDERVRRGSPYCSKDCREVYRKARRDWRATKHCRLCGRPVRKTLDGTASAGKGCGAGGGRSSKLGLLPQGHRAR